MKTAKPPAVEPATGASRRAQPVRRTRTNPARTTAPSNGTHALSSAHPHDQPIDIFPAVTHFADAITALPKELVRHFTLLKEVDAKIFAPEESLFKLIEATLNAPPPDPARSVNDGASSVAPASAPMSAQNSSTGVPFSGHFPAVPSNDEAINTALFDPSNLPRRQLFRQTAFKIQEMLVSLEEKNHVISTANEALQKQLGRIEDLWPQLENEFSDEAKWGSTTHWAYLENRIAKANNNSQAERSRREGAATLSAAAQQLAEEAAARSNDRKQALAAKKNSKNNQANDAEVEGKQQDQASRKSQNTGKARKPAGDAAGGVGLGISTTSGANGASLVPKRRKVENRQANNGAGAGGAEKAMSTVFGASASKPKPTSPSGTPAPEGTKKRKALPTSSSQAKKSRTTAAMSPSVTGSPLIGTFPPEVSKVARSSPAPTNTTRPSSSRARPTTTTHAIIETPTPQPSKPTTSSTKADEPPVSIPSAPVEPSGTRAASEAKIQDEPPAPARPEPVKVESEPQTAAAPLAAASGARKDSMSKPSAEESDGKKDARTPILPPKPQPQLQPPASPAIASTPVLTKSGRASKPSTPSLGTFAEAAAVRSRPSRASENPTSQPKRSHKKGASAAAAAAAMAMAAAAKDDGRSKIESGQDDEDDGDEPRYCYCNGISYGEMVACDADGCKREWFHLDCVGLKVAPKGNAKWYCEDCKKRLRLGSKTVNGR